MTAKVLGVSYNKAGIGNGSEGRIRLDVTFQSGAGSFSPAVGCTGSLVLSTDPGSLE